MATMLNLAQNRIMATEIYHVGSSTNPILLSVAVSTPGIADTDPEVIGSGGIKHLPVISGPTGNLNNVPVGNAGALAGTALGIKTKVDLSPVASSLWPTLLNSLVIHYIVSGGTDGVKNYVLDSGEKFADSTGQFIQAGKLINLVP
jgi:hypothetical protein